MPQHISSFLSFLAIGAVFLVNFACSSADNREKEIAQIPVNVDFDRFDRKFFNASKEEFYSLKQEYGYLFPEQYPDSIWLKRQRDSLQVLLQGEIKCFPI